MVSVKEKIAYGLGDTASNIVFQTVMLFLSFFYTDIFGISPAVVGTLFLVVRIFDAVTDPLMGAMTDRTETKYGKFRPYLLWLALPFGVISVMAFTTPDFGEQGKVVYAFATYALLMIAYTAINIPYSALGGVITGDPKERVSVQSYRFVFGMLGGLIVTACTLPLVEWFGAGDKAKGYQLTIAAMSAVGVLMFLVCFAGTKERVAAPKQDSTFKQDMASLWKNDQWRILSSVALFVLIGMVMRNTLAIYYVKYFLLREDLITAFITLGMTGNIIGCAVAPSVVKRMCKIKVYTGVLFIAAVICVGSYWIQSDQLVLAFVVYFIGNVFLQMGTPLLWAKIADTVDYGQFKTGIRITGMTYSSVVFFIKLGLAVGGAIVGWLLAYYGYEADTTQSAEAVHGILLSFTIFPAVAFIIVSWVMSRYKLDDNRVAEIQRSIVKEAV
ncbi:sugar (glycoside-Pentoside-hexuronide) transporter [Paraglaciecola mesophila KMM 241]|uniref:Sugar (Glycoside-Pentoside-hexuronide) transporter n=1 Tax=Paraglaciecola mesophila KMM 241 TaxID=1128912 RepID=K6YFV5_9ALTE|nr:glycoside-pentoside-hexuronide (GPH):cation symporter [Paraglaciecola mesophila]GAC22831.1 sugar (glycoside-Pentoside-hexuronide) transporter [Paraglaciecola mesophila KMM 241]